MTIYWLYIRKSYDAYACKREKIGDEYKKCVSKKEIIQIFYSLVSTLGSNNGTNDTLGITIPHLHPLFHQLSCSTETFLPLGRYINTFMCEKTINPTQTMTVPLPPQVCLACLTAPPTVILSPCLHKPLCESCLPHLPTPLCPLCRRHSHIATTSSNNPAPLSDLLRAARLHDAEVLAATPQIIVLAGVEAVPLARSLVERVCRLFPVGGSVGYRSRFEANACVEGIRVNFELLRVPENKVT